MDAGTSQAAFVSQGVPRSFLGRLDKLVLYSIPFATTAIVLIPIGFLLVTALSEGRYQGLQTNFSLVNVIQAYTDPRLLTALWNSLVLGVIVSLLATGLAIPMAWLLVRTDMPGRRLFSRLMTLAFYMSPLFLAIAWAAIAAPSSGLVSQFARAFGYTQGFGNIYSYTGIVFVSVLHFVPISFLLLSSAFTAAAE